jgi:hypothetical protein
MRKELVVVVGLECSVDLECPDEFVKGVQAEPCLAVEDVACLFSIETTVRRAWNHLELEAL